MDYAFQFHKPCQVETRTLLLVIGIIVAVALVFQSFALNNGNVLLSLLPTGRVPVFGTSSSSNGDHFPTPVMVGYSTFSNHSNLSDSSMNVENTEASDIGNETVHGKETKGMDRDQENDFASGKELSSDSDFELDLDRNLDNESSSEKAVALVMKSSLDNANRPDSSTTLEKARESEHGLSPEQVGKSGNHFSSNNVHKSDVSLATGRVGTSDTGFEFPLPVLPPVLSLHNMTLLKPFDANSSSSVVSVPSNISSVGKKAMELVSENKIPEILQSGSTPLNNNSTMTGYPVIKKGWIPPTSISVMSSLLLQSHVSPGSRKRPRWSSARDQELLSAKSQIESAPVIGNDPELYASVFQNVSMFKRSYELMEHILKVYIYKEGEKPIFHQPKLNGIYASEGWFMKSIEGNKQFVVKDPRKAHLFYLPFSSKTLRMVLSTSNSGVLAKYLKNYVDMVAGKYRFWNRTGGADHFFVACHDWAPQETRHHLGNCIRALCNANVARGFKIGKDVTLPVTYVRRPEDPLRGIGGKPPSKRTILAFFAGSMHGYLRPILLKYWENKDPAMKIFGPMPRDDKDKMSYIQHMKSSKYCICARGYEVHTPRVVEAIFYECVPVIIADNYVPPFFEVLNWEAFSVFVSEKDIPNLKDILLSIPEKEHRVMQLRVKKVQQHFLWHSKPMKYDIFHMTLHSIWYNRIYQIKPR